MFIPTRAVVILITDTVRTRKYEMSNVPSDDAGEM